MTPDANSQDYGRAELHEPPPHFSLDAAFGISLDKRRKLVCCNILASAAEENLKG
jgi:hypothetical protein